MRVVLDTILVTDARPYIIQRTNVQLQFAGRIESLAMKYVGQDGCVLLTRLNISQPDDLARYKYGVSHQCAACTGH